MSILPGPGLVDDATMSVIFPIRHLQWCKHANPGCNPLYIHTCCFLSARYSPVTISNTRYLMKNVAQSYRYSRRGCEDTVWCNGKTPAALCNANWVRPTSLINRPLEYCPFPLANFSRQSNSLIHWKKILPENYWAVFYDIWTIDRGDIGAYSIKKWGRFDINWGPVALKILNNKQLARYNITRKQEESPSVTWAYYDIKLWIHYSCSYLRIYLSPANHKRGNTSLL